MIMVNGNKNDFKNFDANDDDNNDNNTRDRNVRNEVNLSPQFSFQPPHKQLQYHQLCFHFFD